MFFLDHEWRFTFFNKRAAEELHATAKLVGASIWEAFPRVLGTSFESRYRLAVSTGSPQVFEAYYDPLSAWYEVHAIPVDHGLTVIFRNINERRVAAETLRARERQLDTVFGQTVVGILHRDLKQQVLMVNQRYCEIVGRSREELNGLPMSSFTHPDDLAWNMVLFQQHLKTGDPFHIEKRYIRPDGTAVWCAVNVSFVRDDMGQVASTITVAEDINARKIAEEKARESQSLLQVVIDSIQDLVFVKDREGRFVFTNEQLRQSFGSLEGVKDRDRFPQDPTDIHRETDRQVLDFGKTASIEELILIRGEPRRFQTVKVPWRQDGNIVGVIGISRDLTERLMTEAELVESKRQLASLIHNLPGLVYKCTVAAPWPFSFISEGAEALTGYSADEFLEKKITWGEIVHPEDLTMIENLVFDSIDRKQPFEVAYRIITRSGETRWVVDRGQRVYDSTGAAFLEGIISDITEHKKAEERTIWTAHHDSLTQLPNRILFHKRLEEALQRSAAPGRKVGLLILDLDHLKEVNDTFGHDAGDEVLRVVADRLRSSVRPVDTVARNGGDEFAIILPDIGSTDDIKTIAAPILEQLAKPLPYAGRLLDNRASIGACLWPDHAKAAADLVKQADIALYTAKTTGRGKIVIFEPSMRAEAQQRAQMRNNARKAIETHSIEAFYQPKVHLHSGQIAGFEALLRWRNPHTGIELPSALQAAFDDPHLAVAMGQQMHDIIFRDMRRWLDAGIAFGHIAINASAVEFRGVDFADSILERLRRADIPSHYLEIEVTESVFLGRGAEHIEKALRTLNTEGVRIALDDFGTGYASLSHLKQFPVDVIKVDRSFVRDLADNSEDTAILQAVLKLGQSLGITTVAEGVETAFQATFLRNQGCDLGQGYLFGKADAGSRVPALLASWDAVRFEAPKSSALFE